MDNPVIIFGAKGLGKVAQDIFETNGIVVYGFLDDDASLHGQEYNGISVLGSTDDQGYLKLIGQKCEAFVATDERPLQKSLVKMLMDKRKKMPVNAVHENANISHRAHIGHGNLVNYGVRIGVGAEVGNHCILNTGAVIEHGAKLGDHVQIGAGAIIGDGAVIEDGAFIGAGAIVIGGLKVGKSARIGAGAVVISDAAAKATMFGNPAAELGKK